MNLGKLFTSSNSRLIDVGILVIRLMLGAVMFAHGSQKVLGVFGGKGLETTVGMMSGSYGSLLPYLSAFTEFLGGAAMILGILTRFWGIGILINMSVAVMTVHLKNGFIGQGGFEFPLTLAMIALAITIMGPGRFSLDALLFKAHKKVELTSKAGNRRTMPPLVRKAV
ncbi:MAG: DoxX family protein [Bacteroidota bacterium]|nr:DoxX family protein [Bacteroidota bacterium]MDP4231797.1 DoxX family protein [Bacteroidota bacterium]MDP4242683.1 DoxX family protein [Bacteroidota bacterium]MDP4287134.1 DoxX family protein [Bacteroidota bacterium]